MPTIPVTRTSVRLTPDPACVITKPFTPGDALTVAGRTRLDAILARIAAMSEAEIATTLSGTLARFAGRHVDLRATLEAGYDGVAARVTVDGAAAISEQRRLLIGAYFTNEYSIEAAALTNPSVVEAPDQSGLAPGATRFVLSLRAIGEGHISSIRFRSGVVDAAGEVTLEPPSVYARSGDRRTAVFDKETFSRKLRDIEALNPPSARVLAALTNAFTYLELETAMRAVEAEHDGDASIARSLRTMHWLASSNYTSVFPETSALSERVLFPTAPIESHGMEDARLVRFTDDAGAVTYFATYTAYDGHRILPQLIETTDFRTFEIATLNGPAAKNKGIAIFPRRIGGRFAALSRIDNESNFVMFSDDVRFWHTSELVHAPLRPWELIQVGNCGSPLETEAGWLVITHGVGPLRQYAIGAILLDLDDPRRVIGHLEEPLLEPNPNERDGYVPNVVYSCGSMIAGGRLVLPYGVSDRATCIATVRLGDLLTALTT